MIPRVSPPIPHYPRHNLPHKSPMPPRALQLLVRPSSFIPDFQNTGSGICRGERNLEFGFGNEILSPTVRLKIIGFDWSAKRPGWWNYR
jgi:hypothetical protein